jgi:PPOX class probable F420-dependent enzyme
MSHDSLPQFIAEKYLSLETYRKSGKEVRTPVWFVENNGTLYVRTATDTGKYKRILNNKNVRIAPCGMRGKVKGEWVSAEANLASEDQARQAYQLLEKKYGLIYKMARAVLGGKDYVVIAIKV